MKQWKVILILMLVSLLTLPSISAQPTNSQEMIQYHDVSFIDYLQNASYPFTDRAARMISMMEPSPQPYVNEVSESYSNPLSTLGVGPMNSSWPTKSFNGQRISRTYIDTSGNPGIEKWRFSSSGFFESGAAIDNQGIIYIGCRSYDFYALTPNGTQLWSYKTGGEIFSVPALTEDGTIYFTSTDNKLYALNSNGTLKWQFNTGEITDASPVIAPNGTIYICHSQGRVFAINPNGTEQWHYDLPDDIYGSAALGTDGTIYIGCWDYNFYALNPNGSLKWSYHTGNHVKGVPSIAADGTIYFGSWDGYLYALHPDGSLRWRCQVGYGTETTPAIAQDGTIYVGGTDLYAVYPNGTMRWVFNLGSGHIFKSCPALSAEGTIYVGVEIGNGRGAEMLAVNPDGTERWRKYIDDSWVNDSPAIGSDGTVYIGSTGWAICLHAFGAVDSNLPPNPPTIDGPTSGKPKKEYWYFFPAIDPDNNPVTIFVEWGDGTSQWSYEGASGEPIWCPHTWNEKGTFTVRAKARDVLGLESNWSTMEVTMPFSYEPPQFPFIHWLLERFPNTFPILRQILKL